MKINGYVPVDNVLKNSSSIKENDGDGEKFLSVLKDNLDKINDKQIEADNTTNDFIEGKDVSIHEVMLKTEEAKVSLQLAVQVRNKLVEAYQELNRMQL